jgi:hypothetical protein
VTRLFVIGAIGLALLAGCAAAPCVGQPGTDWVAGEAVVTFKDNVSTEQQAIAVLQSEGLSIHQFVPTTDPLRAFVTTPMGEECATIDRLRRNPSVAFASLSILLHADSADGNSE